MLVTGFVIHLSGKQNYYYERNWIGSSMIVALFALLASGCGHSQRTLEFRGICVDDPQGENGLYNPGRGFRLETAVDVLHEKTLLPKN